MQELNQEVETIPVLVDEFEETTLKSGLPGMARVVSKTVSVSKETLKENLANFIEGISEVLSEVQIESDLVSIETVNLSLMIGANGEVSLLGLKGGLTSQASMQLTLRYKHSTER